MKVRATRVGLYPPGKMMHRVYPGEEFELEDKSHFRPNWMEKVDGRRRRKTPDPPPSDEPKVLGDLAPPPTPV